MEPFAMQSVTSLQWTPLKVVGSPSVVNWATGFQILAATDTNYRISNITFRDTTSGSEIYPKYLTVDNIGNNVNLTVSYAGLNFTIPAYKRTVIALPDKLQFIDFTIPTGQAFIYLSQEKLIDPDQDSYTIQQQAGLTVAYPTLTIISTGNQGTSHANKQILFANSTAITYTLLNPSAFSSGSLSFIQCVGSGIVTIIPPAGVTINNNFTNANPMILYPGDSGKLYTDGSSWYYVGRQHYDSGYITYNLATDNTITHNMFTEFDDIKVKFKCIQAISGYAVGNVISQMWLSQNSTSYTTTVETDKNTLKYRVGSLNAGTVGVLASSNIISLDPPFWNVRFIATKQW